MSDTDVTETARTQAGDWLAALRAQRTPQLEADFRAWLAADPADPPAFDQATRIWDLLGPAGYGFRADQLRRRAMQRVALTTLAACVVVAVGAGAVGQSLKRRKLSAAA